MEESFFDKMSKDGIEGDRHCDCLMIVAGFPVPTEQASRLLPSSILKPIELSAGTATVAFAAMQYREVDRLPPYNEFLAMISILYEDGSGTLQGYFCPLALVSSEEAARRSHDLYRTEKHVARIDFNEEKGMRASIVRAGDTNIASLRVRKMDCVPQSWDMYFFSERDGKLVRRLVRGQGEQGIGGAPEDASFELGPHPLTSALRSLEIGKNTVLCRYSPHWQSMSCHEVQTFDL